MHSITQPHTQPNSLTSTQARSSRVLSQVMASLSVRPICHPAPDQPLVLRLVHPLAGVLPLPMT